jgi:hypothetical protein
MVSEEILHLRHLVDICGRVRNLCPLGNTPIPEFPPPIFALSSQQLYPDCRYL